MVVELGAHGKGGGERGVSEEAQELLFSLTYSQAHDLV